MNLQSATAKLAAALGSLLIGVVLLAGMSATGIATVASTAAACSLAPPQGSG